MSETITIAVGAGVVGVVVRWLGAGVGKIEPPPPPSGVGTIDGTIDGTVEGKIDGKIEGTIDGTNEGKIVGLSVGLVVVDPPVCGEEVGG